MKCIIDNCFRTDVIARFLCSKHHSYFKKHKDLDRFPLMTRKHGTGSINNYGYKRIFYNGKRMLEHRYIIEKLLNRKLKNEEKIHHKDGNRLNNNPNNLEIVSQSYHITHFHNNHPRVYNWNIFIPKNTKFCQVCNKPTIGRKGLCKTHYRTYRYWIVSH